MKRKKFLFLTVLLLVVIHLTACTTEVGVTDEQLKELDDIANEIAIQGIENYDVPVHYSVRQNKEDRERIKIYYNKEIRITAEYIISESTSTATRVECNATTDNAASIVVIAMVIICFLLIVIETQGEINK